jgi:hypothetical protein
MIFGEKYEKGRNEEEKTNGNEKGRGKNTNYKL